MWNYECYKGRKKGVDGRTKKTFCGKNEGWRFEVKVRNGC
jgi:hypothetical protein